MNPCVVVTNSCPSIAPQDIVRQILELESLPEPTLLSGGVVGYEWDVKNKYYQADVNLCILESKSIGNEELAEAVNAVIIPFDSKTGDGLDIAEQWFIFAKEWEPEIKILLCHNCGVTEEVGTISKVKAQNWCVKNGFELVELNPVEDDVDPDDLEDDFPETTGIKRIVQALHAHIWPNLVLRDDGCRPAPHPHLLLQSALITDSGESDPNEELQHNGTSSSDVDPKKKLIAEVKPVQRNSGLPDNVAVVSPLPSVNNMNEDSAASVSVVGQGLSASSLEAGSSNPDAVPSPAKDEQLETLFKTMETMPEESFEELFQNLSEMRKKAEKLSPTHRKKYAEKIAIAFWKSVSGGNESEVEGLSSDED